MKPQKLNPDTLSLPSIERYDVSSNTYFYGAREVAGRYCGLSERPKILPGNWQHGWIPPFCQVGIRKVTMSLHPDPGVTQWVARKDEVTYLKSKGFPQVEAIGLPIVYVEELNTTRIPASLLVMPIHSLDHIKFKFNFDEYAAQIHAIRSQFSRVTVCLHPSCLRNDYWVSSFRKRGFEIVEGAQTTDRNALLRMKTLFSSYEYVTTNGFGSHWPYAAYFGAKVSVFGTFAALTEEHLKNEPLYISEPSMLAPTVEACSEPSLRRRLPHLFVEPHKARLAVEWGAEQLGNDNKRSPGELRALFNWTAKHLFVNAAKAKSRRVMRGLVPIGVKEWLKPPSKQDKELGRIRALPLGSGGETTLFDPPFQFDDAQTFLRTYDRIYTGGILTFHGPVETPRFVIVGAGSGLVVKFLMEKHPNSEITAFEPNEASFEVLQKNFPAATRKGVSLLSDPAWSPTLSGSIDLFYVELPGRELEVFLKCQEHLHNVKRILIHYTSLCGTEQTLPEILELLKKAGFRAHIHSRLITPHPFNFINVHRKADLRLDIFLVR